MVDNRVLVHFLALDRRIFVKDDVMDRQLVEEPVDRCLQPDVHPPVPVVFGQGIQRNDQVG